MNEQTKWEKRITEEDIEKLVKQTPPINMDELMTLMDKYQLQTLKDQQLKDADFEVIEPKQLPNSVSKSEK